MPSAYSIGIRGKAFSPMEKPESIEPKLTPAHAQPCWIFRCTLLFGKKAYFEFQWSVRCIFVDDFKQELCKVHCKSKKKHKNPEKWETTWCIFVFV